MSMMPHLQTRQRVKSSWQIILNYFLRGLLVLLPIALTIGIIIWIVSAVGSLLHFDELGWKALLLYGIIVIAIITIVGFFTKGVVAAQILDFFEGIIEKAPGLNFIFGTTRDVTEAFVGDKKKFTEPIVVEIHEGVFKMGFVTQKSMAAIGMDGYMTVYLPFCYALTGEMLLVQNNKVKPLDMEPSKVTKFVVSGGVVGWDSGTED
jgi:uncharacterized membrane protein